MKKFAQVLREVVEPAKKEDVNAAELFMGSLVELEHTDEKSEAETIALQHLAENENYYEELLAFVEKIGPAKFFDEHNSADVLDGFEMPNDDSEELSLIDQWQSFKKFYNSKETKAQ